MPDTRQTATPDEVAALVAYLEHQLTIPECARRSGLSQRKVTELLDQHQITRRPGDTGTPPADTAAEPSLPPSSLSQPPHPAHLTAKPATGLPGHEGLPHAPQAARRSSRAGRDTTPQAQARPAGTAAQRSPSPASADHAPAAGLALAQLRFLTIAEIALIMRVSKMTVYRLVHDGALEGAVRVGRTFRVPEQTVTSYLRGALATQAGQEPQ